MIVWALIVALLAVFQMVAVYLSFPADSIYLVAVLILLSALGIMFRIYSKEKRQQWERLEKEVTELKSRMDKMNSK